MEVRRQNIILCDKEILFHFERVLRYFTFYIYMYRGTKISRYEIRKDRGSKEIPIRKQQKSEKDFYFHFTSFPFTRSVHSFITSDRFNHDQRQNEKTLNGAEFEQKNFRRCNEDDDRCHRPIFHCARAFHFSYLDFSRYNSRDQRLRPRRWLTRTKGTRKPARFSAFTLGKLPETRLPNQPIPSTSVFLNSLSPQPPLFYSFISSAFLLVIENPWISIRNNPTLYPRSFIYCVESRSQYQSIFFYLL